MSKGTRPGTKRMEAGKRSPTAHRTLEQGQAQVAYEAQPHRKKYRAELNGMREELGLKKGDGKEVGHKKAASKGGSMSKDNVKVVSRRVNRTNGTKEMK